MWPRVSEFVMGCWLITCPVQFVHGGNPTAIWIHDILFGAAICLLALLSFSRRFRHAHLATGLLAAWLILEPFLESPPAPAGLQNHILLGLTLLMFAIIPNQANLPPESWRTREFRGQTTRTPNPHLRIRGFE